MSANLAHRLTRNEFRRSNIQMVEAEARVGLRNITTNVTLIIQPSLFEISDYQEAFANPITWGLQPSSLLEPSPERALSYLFPKGVVVQSFKNALTIQWNEAGTATYGLKIPELEKYGAVSKGQAYWPLQSQGIIQIVHDPETYPCIWPTAFQYQSYTDLKSTKPEKNEDEKVAAARIVAATRELPTPSIYSTSDDGLILDYVWEGARLSCILRPSYAHVMTFFDDEFSETTLEGERLSETEIISIAIQFSKKVNGGSLAR